MEQNPLAIQAEFFDALAHPARLEILELLRGGEACVCHLQALLNHRQAYISQQMNVLRQAGLVTSRKQGQWIYYKISDPALFEVIDGVKAILQSTGKWQPMPPSSPTLEQLKKSCNCPQCS